MVILTLLAFGIWKKKKIKEAENMEVTFADLDDVENEVLEDDAIEEGELNSTVESIEMKLEDTECSLKRKIILYPNDVDAKKLKHDTPSTSSESYIGVDDVKIEVFAESESSSHTSDSPDDSTHHRVVERSKSEGLCRTSFSNLFRQKYQTKNEIVTTNNIDYAANVPPNETETFHNDRREVLYEYDTSTNSSDTLEINNDPHLVQRRKSQGHCAFNFTKLFSQEEQTFKHAIGEGHAKRKIMVEEGYANRKIMEVGKRPELELYRPGLFSTKQLSRKDDFLHKNVQQLSNPFSAGCSGTKNLPNRPVTKIGSAEKSTKDISPGSVFDTHCHLDFCGPRLPREVDTLEKMLEVDGEGMKLYRKGGSGKFGGCIAIYCDPRNWGHRLLENAQQRGVHVSLGCHPHFVEHLRRDSLEELESLVRVESRLANLVALGEIGLDYSSKNRGVKKEVQKSAFKTQLRLALKYQLPVVLHIRDAEEDGYQVLEDAQVPASYPLHLHCFTGGWIEAKRWLRRFPASVIGLTGVVTFPNAVKVHEVAREIPLDRLLLETDAPYMLPRGVDRAKYKDSVCLPGHVIHTAERIAALRGDTVRNILEANLKNVERIYGIKIAK